MLGFRFSVNGYFYILAARSRDDYCSLILRFTKASSYLYKGTGTRYISKQEGCRTWDDWKCQNWPKGLGMCSSSGLMYLVLGSWKTFDKKKRLITGWKFGLVTCDVALSEIKRLFHRINPHGQHLKLILMLGKVWRSISTTNVQTVRRSHMYYRQTDSIESSLRCFSVLVSLPIRNHNINSYPFTPLLLE